MGSENFLVHEHVEVLGEGMPGESIEAACPLYLFSLAVPELYPFIISW